MTMPAKITASFSHFLAINRAVIQETDPGLAGYARVTDSAQGLACYDQPNEAACSIRRTGRLAYIL